ncbi:MAG: WD40 repeat domain-containing protein [Alphaproteobacteria bacterium]|nr:WD40 repeat domain-containing protein [Alphaproteobacteria bacterium]
MADLTWQAGAHVAALAFDAGGRLGLALGDGRVQIVRGDKRIDLACQDGAMSALVAQGPDLIAGGDDGRLRRIAADDSPAEIAAWPGQWIEHLAVDGGRVLAGVGKRAVLIEADGRQKSFLHPSTVGGVAFFPGGKRVAVAHYGGVSLWWTKPETQEPKRLAWKGSHLAVAVSPDGKYVVTAMQENALHGWRLADAQDMRMSGYAAKPRSFAFAARPNLLVTSGADVIVAWPFSGPGPMGKPPLELGGLGGPLVMRVACHPSQPIAAAGYESGAIQLVDLAGRRGVGLREGGEAPITALAFSPGGERLAFGSDAGEAGLIDLAALALDAKRQTV